MRLGLAPVVGELDAARLAAPADQHLRLDDAGIAQLVGGGDRLLDGGGGGSAGHGNAAAGEQLLALVLEQVHDGADSSRGLAGRAPPRARARQFACHNPTSPMPLPKEVTFVTFDVYGTLIDWETGVYDAFAKEADKDGYTLSREELIPLFHQIQQEIKGGSYELYAEVLRRTAVQISRQLGWPLEPSRSGFLPDSVKRWPPFKETNTQLDRFAKKCEVGLVSNIDDKLLGETRRHFKSDFDLVVTAQQVRSYKPDPAHFKEAERRIGGKKGWVHVASSYYYDVEPCIKAKVPVIWVNRGQGDARAEPEEADGRGQVPPRGREAARRGVGRRGEGRRAASRRRRRHLAHLPDDLHARAVGRARRSPSTRPCCRTSSSCCPPSPPQAGFRVVGCLVTHGDWDHLLGRYAFPDAPLGIAESTAARLRNEPGEAQRELRAFDDEHYVERPGPLSLGRPEVMQALPVPGHCGLGERELELHLADGHTEDGMAVWIPWARVLACGDYLSPVEIPWLSERGSARAYLATLRRLAPLVEQADHVVPGHGAVLDGTRAAAILGEDVAYLEALLERGAGAPLPLARRGAAQRRIHAENVARVA